MFHKIIRHSVKETLHLDSCNHSAAYTDKTHQYSKAHDRVEVNLEAL